MILGHVHIFVFQTHDFLGKDDGYSFNYACTMLL